MSQRHLLRSRVNRGFRRGFGAAPQGGVAQLGIQLLQRESADDALAEQLVVDGVRIGLRLNDELVKARRSFKQQRRTGLLELTSAIVRLRQVLLGKVLQSFTAVYGHEDAAHES